MLAISDFGSKDDPSLKLLSQILDELLDKIHLASIVRSGSCDLFALSEYARRLEIFASFSTFADSGSVETYLYNTVKDIIRSGITLDELERAK